MFIVILKIYSCSLRCARLLRSLRSPGFWCRQRIPSRGCNTKTFRSFWNRGDRGWLVDGKGGVKDYPGGGGEWEVGV